MYCVKLSVRKISVSTKKAADKCKIIKKEKTLNIQTLCELKFVIRENEIRITIVCLWNKKRSIIQINFAQGIYCKTSPRLDHKNAKK